MVHVGVLLPPRWDAMLSWDIPSIIFVSCPDNLLVERSIVRVKCLVQEYNTVTQAMLELQTPGGTQVY